jgi:DNA polymerase III alpha subunit
MPEQIKFDCGCVFPVVGPPPLPKSDLPAIRFDPYHISLECQKTWDIFCKGWTVGVFQLEKKLGQQWSRELQPVTLEHIAALTALLRPGCLRAVDENGISMTQHYCNRKNEKETVEFYHESLKPILDKTFGQLIFQEQSLQIVKDLASFSLIEADELRRGIGKKKADLISKLGKLFKEKAATTGILNAEEAAHIFDWIEKSNRYSFNKCVSGKTILKRFPHSGVYGSLTVEEMYHIKNDIEYAKRAGHLNLYKKFKLQQHYGYGFSLNQDGRIRRNIIRNIYYSGKQSLYRVILENDSYIDATHHHKFPTPNGELTVAELNVGDLLYYCNKPDTTGRAKIVEKGYPSSVWPIKSIEYIGDEDTYDIEMDAPNHTFVTLDNIVTCNSHAVSYGILSYLTAYCKAHFPLQFYTSYLYYAKEKQQDYLEEIHKLVQDAKLFDIEVKTPDLRTKFENFHTDGKDIYVGLCDVKGIGQAALNSLLEVVGDKEWTWNDFLILATDKISSDVVKALILCGALDYMGVGRRKMLYEYEKVLQLTPGEFIWLQKNIGLSDDIRELFSLLARTKKEGGGVHNKNRLPIVVDLAKTLNDPPFALVDSPNWVAYHEKRLLGISLSCTMLDSCDTTEVTCTCKEFIKGKNDFLVLGVQIDEIRQVKVKNGKNAGAVMAFLTVSDESSSLADVVVYSKTFSEIKHLLFEGNTIILHGERDRARGSLVVKKVWQI